MVKCNFDDLGVAELLVMRATVFILGVRGHLVEKVQCAQSISLLKLPLEDKKT